LIVEDIKKLVVISHTAHRKSEFGQLFGWGPTVEEINYLSNFFDKVIHVSCYEQSQLIPKSYRKYVNSNVEFLPIPLFGGASIFKKLGILFKMPTIVRQIEKALIGASHVQLRVPMGIGVFLIPYFSLRSRKFIFWLKYANNWGDPSPKMGFRIQRYMLKQNWANCKVTINGNWQPNQEDHCISFENPCLYKNEVLDLTSIYQHKQYSPPYKLLFVGRIEHEKGVGIVLDWLSNVELNKIEKITFVGEGKDLDCFLKKSKDLGLENIVVFTGSRTREEIQKLYKEYHFFLFPSMASEGFPKVIAEAMAFGCVPITSEVSSLKEFLQKSDAGISWADFVSQEIENIKITESMIERGFEIARKYTFENYIDRLNREVFN
jgi:glycosyltransferase involved in cell wall biosynthesis